MIDVVVVVVFVVDEVSVSQKWLFLPLLVHVSMMVSMEKSSIF